jgi:hypothetical protein
MGLTRKFLKAMGIEDEKIDQIVDAHTETVDGLKNELKTAQEKANKLDGVEKELNDLKAKGEDGYKEKYEKEHKAFEDYKNDVTAKQTKAAKEAAAKAYFEAKNITGANLSIAMRGARDEINSIELDENGKIKDAKALDELVAGEYAGLIVSTSTKGAKTATPPANNGGGMTKEQIFAIKDAGERQKAIAEHLDLFT